MRATRILRTTGSGFSGLPSYKLLLPQPTLLDTIGDALQGWWAHLSDQPSRDAYEQAVEKYIIKDTVLQSASSGIIMTYSLFHNLQNPLFQKYEFDMKEFVDTVGPALENFHYDLALLLNEFSKKQEQQKEEKEEELLSLAEEQPNDRPIEQTIPSLFGIDQWRKQAKEDENSLAGRLSKMTTEVCLDALYYQSKLKFMTRDTLLTKSTFPVSVKVHHVALLNARAMVLTEDGKEAFDEFSGFQAIEEEQSPTKNENVAAQMDVLFEVSHEYVMDGSVSAQLIAAMASVPPLPTASYSEEASNEEGDIDSKTGKGDTVSTLTFTHLGVAVFEGWLHRTDSGEKDSLRWKISMLRDAVEFPDHQPLISHNKRTL